MHEPGSKLQNALFFAASKLRKHLGTKPILYGSRFDKVLGPNVRFPVPTCIASVACGMYHGVTKRDEINNEQEMHSVQGKQQHATPHQCRCQ